MPKYSVRLHVSNFINRNAWTNRVGTCVVEFAKDLFNNRNHLRWDVCFDGGVVKVAVVVAVIDDTDFTHMQFCLCI